jgi:MFS family permease
MSDLAAAAAALGAPEAIVKRSAEARAKATGVSVDAILTAWAGGSAAPVAAAVPAEPQSEQIVASSDVATSIEDAQPLAVPAPPTLPAVAMLEEEEEEEKELPVAEPLAKRIRVAGRIGAASGAVLGVLGLIAASPWLLPNASILGTEGDFSPAVIVDRGRLTLVTALFSLVFGAIVAALSRTVAGWLSPANALVGRVGATSLAGSLLGLVLGFGAGAVLASFGQPVENAENLIQLPVVATIFVVLLGGAFLGWLTGAAVQIVGIPAGVHHDEAEEVATVQRRLVGAIGVPVAGIVALAVLVLPLAIVLIRSSHLSAAGAPILAIIASASILAVASLSASKPGMKISRGEFLLALGGIGVVLMIVMAVLLARSPVHEEEETAEAGATTTVVEGEARTTVAP